VSTSSLVIENQIEVSGIPIKIVRKTIKNIHLGVYPPDGHVRVAVPQHVTDDNVRLAVISRLKWIKEQQARFQTQPRQSQRQLVTGESHYFFGKRYRLEVVERRGSHQVVIKNNRTLQLLVNPGTTQLNRALLLNEWYRQQLKERIPELLSQWEPVIGKTVTDWGVKKMKTKWGSCNITQKRIWLNLELAKKPVDCLEYVLVHEMVHLLERNHDKRFIAYLDHFLPRWRQFRDILKSEPLKDEKWIN
jgi:predicted metal-dependent hydrolase